MKKNNIVSKWGDEKMKFETIGYVKKSILGDKFSRIICPEKLFWDNVFNATRKGHPIKLIVEID